MTLTFNREVVILAGVPVIGRITVEVEGQLDRHDGLWRLDLAVTGFESETTLGLAWAAVAASCDAWLAANKARVEKKALAR